jgi:dTDP-4-dehydrorhamnose reductase
MPVPSVAAAPADNAAFAALELWGGVEGTVNRVGETYLDQFALSGHRERIDDLDQIAALGIRTLRYPILWETTTAPSGSLDDADWTWPDARLARLQALGVRPIVGLVHHGSGPRHTSLVDESFAPGLARFARAVAERYPWVDAYTPVNEPLTTARFAGLYGHWYPHGRDERTFLRALLNQCRATVLAMRAIREVNPRARLVQTEDMGKTWSTPALAYQAEFENERRWVTWDLLCGRVNGPHSRMWHHFRWAGFSDAEIAWFADNPCPPDILGVNHYLTSERFLDTRTERYPDCTPCGNGRDTYVDVEAVRVVADGAPAGPGALLREAWERYGLPLAITEAHLGCTRDEQMRWLWDVWRQCEAAKQDGANVRAMTVWSLLGAIDWDSLLTRNNNSYEPGAFDLRTPTRQPRATALAALVRDLAHAHTAGSPQAQHPVLDTPGWWRRPTRLLYPPVSLRPEAKRSAASPAHENREHNAAESASARPILIWVRIPRSATRWPGSATTGLWRTSRSTPAIWTSPTGAP